VLGNPELEKNASVCNPVQLVISGSDRYERLTMNDVMDCDLD